jgi:hypothetical protein
VTKTSHVLKQSQLERIIDETLIGKLHSTKHLAKGEKKEQRERTQVQNPKWVSYYHITEPHLGLSPHS